MKPEKISHLKEDGTLRNERKKRVEYTLAENGGKIVSYQPYKSLQLIFYDLHTSDLPDLWKLGFRKGSRERYVRALICQRGSCEFTINGKTDTISEGQIVTDYGVGDNLSFGSTTDDFAGVEIAVQESLTNQSSMFRMLRLVLESMYLPEEEVFDSDGYIFSISKNSEQTLDKLLAAGLDGVEGIMVIALTLEIIHNLSNDLKNSVLPQKANLEDKQIVIARDIYRCLSEDFGTKYTAAQFAEKYGVSDTTVKKYFKKQYGYGFKEYQTKVRMEWAAAKLATSSMKVGEISEKTGYSKQTKFTKAFKNYFNTTPLRYRQSVRRNDYDD